MNGYEDMTVEKAYAMGYERGFSAVLQPLNQFAGNRAVSLLLSPVEERGLSLEDFAISEAKQLKEFVGQLQKRYDELEEV